MRAIHTEALEGLLEQFLNFKQTNVDDGSPLPAKYSSPEEMEQAFEEWVDSMVHGFVSEQDWVEIFRARGEEDEA